MVELSEKRNRKAMNDLKEQVQSLIFKIKKYQYLDELDKMERYEAQLEILLEDNGYEDVQSFLLENEGGN